MSNSERRLKMHTPNKKALPHLERILSSKSIREVVKSTDLAQIGDFLTNFVYTTMRIGIKGKGGSIHVWDRALTNAARDTGLIRYFPNRFKRDKIADGVEALIAFAYFNSIISLSEMIDILASWIGDDDLKDRKIEVLACQTAFEQLIRTIFLKAKANGSFEDLDQKLTI